MFQLLAENTSSYLIILLGIIVAIGIGFWIYSFKSPFTILQKKIISILRAFSIFLIFILIADLQIIHNQLKEEKPIFIIAIDNSKSVGLFTSKADLEQLKEKIENLKSDLSKKGIVKIHSISGSKNTFDFVAKQSDLGRFIDDLLLKYENQHIAGMFFISDGIVTEGVLPTYKNYLFPIHTLALGNPKAQNDVFIKEINYNKTVLKGNIFPINVTINQNGFNNQSVKVQVFDNKKMLHEKAIVLNKKLQNMFFETEANKTGFKKLTIKVTPLSGEYTQDNNVKDIFVEVIEAKEKILVLAGAPHPDLGTIKKSLEQGNNREIELTLLPFEKPQTSNPDLVIMYQIPNYQRIGSEYITKYVGKKPILWIAGNQSDWQALNQINEVLLNSSFQRKAIDKVQASLNPEFEAFQITDIEKNILQNWPPLSVPFGDLKLKEGSKSILFQKIGNTLTNKPLFTIQLQKNPQSALWAGEGIWMWRMDNYRKNENFEFFDLFLSKSISLLIESNIKNRFKVYPAQKQGNTLERFTLQTEIFNKVGDAVFEQEVQLFLQDEKGKKQQFTYYNSKENQGFKLPLLKAGNYYYQALTILGNESLRTKGEFAINELDVESFETVANHEMLQLLSEKTNGKFMTPKTLDVELKTLSNRDYPSKLINKQNKESLINMFWLLALLLCTLTSEWMLRKYWGGY